VNSSPLNQVHAISDAVMCYTCDHVAHPRDCDSVVECKPNEVYAIQLYNYITI